MCLANGFDALGEEADAFGGPGEFLFGDDVVGGVAGFDIGAFDAFEGAFFEAARGRPDIDEVWGYVVRQRDTETNESVKVRYDVQTGERIERQARCGDVLDHEQAASAGGGDLIDHRSRRRRTRASRRSPTPHDGHREFQPGRPALLSS